MQIVVLTREERFRALLQRLAGSRHALTYVSEFPEALAAVARTGAGVAVADTACLGPDPVAALESLRQASPNLVTVAYGERDEGGRLMELVSRGVLFRFIVRPATPGQSRLYIEAAAKRAEEGREAAPEPWKKRQPPPPPVADRLRAPVIPAGITVVALAATAILLSRGPGPRPPDDPSAGFSQAGGSGYRIPAAIAPRGDVASGRIGLMAADGAEPGASPPPETAAGPADAATLPLTPAPDAGLAAPDEGVPDGKQESVTPEAGRAGPQIESPSLDARRPAASVGSASPRTVGARSDVGPASPDAGRSAARAGAQPSEDGPVAPVAGDVGVVDAAELVAREAGSQASGDGSRIEADAADPAPGPAPVAATGHEPTPEPTPEPMPGAAGAGTRAPEPDQAGAAAARSESAPAAEAIPAAGGDAAGQEAGEPVAGTGLEPQEAPAQPTGEAAERPPTPGVVAEAQDGDGERTAAGTANPDAPEAVPMEVDGAAPRPEPLVGLDGEPPGTTAEPDREIPPPEPRATRDQGLPGPTRVAALDTTRASAPSGLTGPSTAVSPVASRREADPDASGPRGGQAELPAAEDDVGGEPRRVRYVAPDYPREAWLNRQEGRVKLRFLIGSSGAPQAVTVVSASPRRVFDRAAIEAVEQWRYQPPGPGAADPAQVEIEIEFRMD